MFQFVCVQECPGAKHKAIFELWAATIVRNNPHVCMYVCMCVYIIVLHCGQS